MIAGSNRAAVLPVLFVASVLAFPRTFIELKLVLLGLILIHFAAIFHSRTIHISRRMVGFYGAFIFVGLLAALVGTSRGNPQAGIWDGIRLYVMWSILIPFLLTYLQQFNAMLVIHYGVLLAAFTTAAIDITSIYSNYVGWSVYPDWFADAMLLKVGFHDGYVQIIAHNIGMLLFIAPYLLVTVLRTDGRREKPWLVGLALAAVLATVAFSGRRGLWLVVGITPFLIWMIALASGTQSRIKSYPLFVAGTLVTFSVVVAFPLIFFSDDMPG